MAAHGLAATAPGIEGIAGPSVAPSLSAAPRSGDFHVTKECSQFQTDSFCTILTSNVKAIEVGTRVVYLQPEQVGTPSGSDVVLYPPGPGNNTAFGHCSVALGVCTFGGGTGKFMSFQASVDVTHTSDFSSGTGKGRTALIRRIESRILPAHARLTPAAARRSIRWKARNPLWIVRPLGDRRISGGDASRTRDLT